MKVQNMTSEKGNTISNQFIITEKGNGANGNFATKEIFQSYDSVIAVKTTWLDGKINVELDPTYWDYSKTTGKYRNLFLNEKKPETEQKIKNGIYKLVNLN